MKQLRLFLAKIFFSEFTRQQWRWYRKQVGGDYRLVEIKYWGYVYWTDGLNKLSNEWVLKTESYKQNTK